MGKNKDIFELTTRDLTITLTPVSGGLTQFQAFVNDIKVIQDSANEERSWTGKIPEAKTKITVRAIGIDDASFDIGIDLPGTINDQTLSVNLNDGYFETDIFI